MKAVDAFLERHGVDVGKSLGVLALAGAVFGAFEMLGHVFIGRLRMDLSVPLGLIVGIALWRHASWSRTLLIGISWATVGVLAVLLVLLPFIGTSRLTLTVGSTAIKNPPLWQTYVFHAGLVPVAWFILAVLHSERAKAEFGKPIQPAPRDDGKGPSSDSPAIEIASSLRPRG